MELREVAVEPVAAEDEGRYQRLMAAHHYLGALPKIGETLWYAARWRGDWVALIGFSAPALKCGARDRWIGWDFRTQYGRQHLLANNSRFLILPGGRAPNLGSRVLALCGRRLAADWPARFGHPLLLLETFVDPARFRGTVYRAANWTCVGRTRGFRRVRGGYRDAPGGPKLVFVRPLVADARERLTRPALDPIDRHGGPKAMISADTMRSLPDYFADIDDPRRRQGRRHPLPVVLALAAGATLCGARGYKAMAEWAEDLSPRARERFRCRRRGGRYEAPSEYVIRDVLVRVDPAQLDLALQRFHADRGIDDEAIAIDGKTMRNAIYTDEPETRTDAAEPAAGKIDEGERQVHILGAIGQRSGVTHTQKKSTACPVGADDETKRTNEIGAVIPMLEGLRLDFADRTFTADALLTQRQLADFLRAREWRPLRVHRQGQPADPPRRPPALLRPPRRARLPRAPRPRTRAPRKPRHLDHHPTQRPPELSARRPGLPRRAHRRQQEVRQDLRRNRPRHHQPHPRHRQPPPPARTQPRPLEGRVHPQHPRQHLRRGSPAYPNRPRPREHHPPATLRHRPHPRPRQPLRRRRHAPAQPQPAARLRLLAHDRKHAQAPKPCASQRENKLAVGVVSIATGPV